MKELTARELIVRADAIRRDRGLSQAEWSRLSGLDEVGMTISRAYKRGNCKISTFNRLIDPLGYELVLVKKGDSL